MRYMHVRKSTAAYREQPRVITRVLGAIVHNRKPSIFFVSAIKSAVELYKSQEKNGKLRMLILRLFQTKLISSKQLATG